MRKVYRKFKKSIIIEHTHKVIDIIAVIKLGRLEQLTHVNRRTQNY